MTADHDEARDNQAAALDRLIDSLAIESVAAGGLTSEPVAPKTCRGGGETFYMPTIPPVADPDIRYGHWSAEQIDDATARCQPLVDPAGSRRSHALPGHLSQAPADPSH